MKALKTLLVGALLAFAGNAMGQSTLTLTAEDVVIEAGSTADLTISMENNFDMAAWSVKLYLPEGIKLAYDEEEEEYCIELSSRHKKKHSFGVTLTADGGYLIIVAAGTNVPPIMEGNSGEVATITLEADATFTGTATGTIKDIQGSTQDAVQTNQEGEVQFNITEQNTATGINSVNLDAQSGKIYNLNGQRVEKAQNGIFIKNGKKVVVK